MSYLEGPKARFISIAALLAAGATPNASNHLKPGCVQCGSLLDISDTEKNNFSGKCFSCEHWVSDEQDDEDDYEDLED